MEQYYGYIYMTTNLINNMKYIGKKKGKLNDSYLGSGVYLKRAIEKYGKHSFEQIVLDVCPTKEKLNDREMFWINHYNAVESKEFYNIAKGGDGGDIVSTLSPEAKEQLKQKHRAKIGSLNNFYGRSHSDESIEKMMNTKREKGLIKPKQPKPIKEKDTRNGMYGKKGSEALNGKKVYQYADENMTVFVKEYNTVGLVQQALGIKGHSALAKAINNKKQYKGYYWSKEKSATTISQESTGGDKHHLKVQSLTSA